MPLDNILYIDVWTLKTDLSSKQSMSPTKRNKSRTRIFRSAGTRTKCRRASCHSLKCRSGSNVSPESKGVPAMTFSRCKQPQRRSSYTASTELASLTSASNEDADWRPDQSRGPCITSGPFKPWLDALTKGFLMLVVSFWTPKRTKALCLKGS